MHHRDRYREHRIRTSLQNQVGRSPIDREAIERLVDDARRAGVIVFLARDLERMPWASAEIIRTEHRRLHRESR